MVGKVGDSLHLLLPGLRPLRGHDQRHDEGRSPARTRDDAGDAGQARGKAAWLEKKAKDPFSISEARKIPASFQRLAIHPDARRGYRSCSATSSTLSMSGVAVTCRSPAADRNAAAIGACIGRVSQAFSERVRRQVSSSEQSRDGLNSPDRADGAGLSASSLRRSLGCRPSSKPRCRPCIRRDDEISLTPLPAALRRLLLRREAAVKVSPSPPCLPAVSAA